MSSSWLNQVKIEPEAISWSKGEEFPVQRIIKLSNGSKYRLACIITQRMPPSSCRRFNLNKSYFSVDPESTFELVVTISEGDPLDSLSYLGVHIDVLPADRELKQFCTGKDYHAMAYSKYLPVTETEVIVQEAKPEKKKKKTRPKKNAKKINTDTKSKDGCLEAICTFVGNWPKTTMVVSILFIALIAFIVNQLKTER